MHVVTKTEQLDRLRRGSMNFMFAGHPGDCGGCRSFGNCELQALFQYLNASVNQHAPCYEKRPPRSTPSTR